MSCDDNWRDIALANRVELNLLALRLHRAEHRLNGRAATIRRLLENIEEHVEHIRLLREQNAVPRAAAVSARHDMADELLDSAIRLAGRLVRTADDVGVEDVALRCRAAGMIKTLVENVERLQATVDKLPRTADGVPVVPGMEGTMVTPDGPTTVRAEMEFWEPGGKYWWASHLVFSTRQAAEQARKESKG